MDAEKSETKMTTLQAAKRNLLISDLVIRANADEEKTRYEILAELKKKRKAFEGKKLYPGLSRLVEARRNLHSVQKHRDDLIENIESSAEIKRIDFINRVIQRKDVDLKSRDEVYRVLHLSDWAIPKLDEVITIGAEVHEDVADAIKVDWVGTLSRYVDEGFLIISTPLRHKKGQQLRLFSYQRMQYLVRKQDDSYCKLVMSPVEPPSKATDVSQLKSDLINSRSEKAKSELPNPATVLIESSSTYPFSETVLPIAKRQLLRWLKDKDAAREGISPKKS